MLARPRLSRLPASALALAALASLMAAAVPARAIVVERVVAVINDRPILLSELRKRAHPYVVQVQGKVPAGPQLVAAESQIMKEVMEKVVDEQLEQQAAEKSNITVTPEEVEASIKNLASMQGMTVPDHIKEATARLSMSETDYREELRRQILEGKMLQLRVKGRVRITEEDVRSTYERTLREERHRREYHPAWIVLRLIAGSTPAVLAERRALAVELVDRARKGEKFADLARSYSDDTATRDQGGDLGIRAPQSSQAAAAGKRQTLSPELEAAVMPLEPGQVADAVEIPQAIVILSLASRQASHYTTYEAAKPEMLQRLQSEILEKAKRKWLDELKGRTHLDVRL